MTLLVLLRLSFVAIGVWYGIRALRRRFRPNARLGESLDPTLTRVLRYLGVFVGIFAVCFVLYMSSIIRGWPAWVERSSYLVGAVAFVIALALALVGGWRSYDEDEKAESLTRRDEHVGP